MVAFNPENDTAALDALMELTEAPGQCIKHPEFIENYPGSDYVMTPAMYADEYDLVMSGNPDGDFWDIYVVTGDRVPCCVEIICPYDNVTRESFIQHWDDGKITIVMYKNDDEFIA